MASVKVNIRTEILDGEKWNRAIAKSQKEVRGKAERRLARVSPILTGRLSEGWEVRGKGLGLQIANPVPYTSFQNDGTKYIKAKRMVERATPYIVDIYEKRVVKNIDSID